MINGQEAAGVASTVISLTPFLETPCTLWHLVKPLRKFDQMHCAHMHLLLFQHFQMRNSISPLHLPPAGFPEAGAVFLLLGAPTAGASSGPNPTGLLAGAGAPAAPRGAEPHP